MKTARFFIFFSALIFGCQTQLHTVKDNRLYFYLHYPEAHSVQLRCSLDGYKEHPAEKTGEDMWEVSVPFTPEFSYFYIVDNEIFLPPCRLKEKDDFGSENCIFVSDM